MASTNQTGAMNLYYNGQPYQGVASPNNFVKTGWLTNWYNGQPYQFVIPGATMSNYFFMFG